MLDGVEYLDRAPSTYTSASKKERNILHQIADVRATRDLYQKLWDCRDTICALTRHHLQISRNDTCVVLPPQLWIQGSFNICVLVEVTSRGIGKKFVLRCPMPHKLAEERYPGTVDEKLSCEVGTYVWMQKKCSDIRIPFLHGFGSLDQRHYTREEKRPFYVRLRCLFWRSIYRVFCYPELSKYTPISIVHNLPTAYMLLEYIKPETGQVLSNTWEMWREDPDRRKRLEKGIAHLMLSLARIPQPRIGAFRFNHDCTITLLNRPLTCATMMLENDGVPRIIQQNDTYLQTEPFVSDMISMHDEYLVSNPNAVYSAEDCRSQMSIRTLLRALSHHYIRRERRNGPFILQFTDFHASNIFVDEEWNITCLIDLEWVCALPVEMLAVPYWLTGRCIDELRNEHFDEFNRVRQEFMHMFEEEERGMASERNFSLARIMNKMWESRGVWFWYSLESFNAILFVIEEHICPRFSPYLSPECEKVLSRFWREDSGMVVEQKVNDQKQYDLELRRAFGKEEPCSEQPDGKIGIVKQE
ncbi:hypothetical protein EJ05DRAFT_497744 [Pseudovirgaria hyperparasitica]|uniref:Aminoglycoside phosphotransferase domain-containing protein n=1 Tax=Pseudovirgaria hyperparasitica TaxID=470096 RepID=A0A6A6WHR2_9PEZI|nr:uncharacterized protein EJ05DRAFT_497744 [Pseudovirgaria hyperparasitica]KAF2761187.1 hypothetical protein EJ05DRAFT_497744 [Pseudovirgaria hyperparasitica]